ncbi:MAG: sugar ABC transporter permease [Hyphomicrobiales bacterium]|nr:sugar ABC transporter permease [Hyphomicrobiales bacterium]
MTVHNAADVPAVAAEPSRPRPKERGSATIYRFFVVPTLVINFAIILIPAVLTVILAFFRWDGISAPEFIGFGNFTALADNRVFWRALQNNIIWTAIFLTIPVAMGLVAASLLLILRRGRTLLQAIYFLPVIIATVITARIWQGMIYNPQSGIVGLMNRHGFEVTDPLASTSTALFGVATVDLWHWWGFLAVIFFAALRQVPIEQIEAARLEGATYPQMMWYVLIPAIRPTIMLMMIMTVIWSFLVFDFIFIMTQGGPAFSSEVLSTLAYRKAFFELDVGGAAATALVISLFGLAATFLYLRIQAREGDE